MPNPPGVGAIPSADIAVPDPAALVAFYAAALTTGPAPLWRDDHCSLGGEPVLGVGAQTPAYADLPRQWMPHIQVAAVAASVAAAQALGGAALLHHRDDDGVSQWAVLRDPSGAAFGVIQAGPAAPPSAGHIAGANLPAPDAGHFYAAVVGGIVDTRPLVRASAG